MAVALAAAIFVAVQRGAGAPSDAPTVGDSQTAQVVRVVDGDTIVVRIGGREERVRYIGVDTPESVKPDTPVQCFAERASAFNAKLVEGKAVRLDQDVDARDRYGRLLAYVHAGGVFVNAELVRRGYARPLTVPPNVRYADRFARLASQARERGSGLWSACSS